MGYIYMIRNTVNGKAYIGQTINKLETRINDHFSLTQTRRGSRLLKRAIHKYGRDAFTVEILHDGVLNIFLDDLEISEIKKHNTLVPHGYNLDSGGNANKSHSLETRRKMSETRKGKKLSPEHRKKISEAHKGKSFSPEHRRKVSEANKRRKHSLEARRKISEARKGKGKPRTLETRRKISEAKKGKYDPERIVVFEILNSLPESMPLTEKRKILFNKFLKKPRRTIYRWVKQWSQTS